MTIDDSTRIRVIRALLGMSSMDFAKRIGICVGTMTAWERGRSSPQGENKRSLAEFCKESGIGFLPSGMPVPFTDCFVCKPAEESINA